MFSTVTSAVAGEDDVSPRLEGSLQVRGGEGAAPTDYGKLDAGIRAGGAGFVPDDVGLVADDHLVPRRGQDLQRDLVGHGAARHEQRGLLAEHGGASRACSSFTEGSSPYWSSPTGASAIAARMPAEGLVTVSERKSTVCIVLPLDPVPSTRVRRMKTTTDGLHAASGSKA